MNHSENITQLEKVSRQQIANEEELLLKRLKKEGIEFEQKKLSDNGYAISYIENNDVQTSVVMNAQGHGYRATIEPDSVLKGWESEINSEGKTTRTDPNNADNYFTVELDNKGDFVYDTSNYSGDKCPRGCHLASGENVEFVLQSNGTITIDSVEGNPENKIFFKVQNEQGELETLTVNKEGQLINIATRERYEQAQTSTAINIPDLSSIQPSQATNPIAPTIPQTKNIQQNLEP